MQQVANCGEKHFPVDIERKFRVNLTDRKDAPSRVRLERGGYFYIGNKIGEGHQLTSRKHSRCYAHIGQRAIYETSHPNQGTVQYGSRCAAHSDVARFDGCNGKSRDVKMVSQLVREKSKPFVQSLYAKVLDQRVALKRIFGHRIRDTIVETAVESSKLVYLDRSAAFECEIGYGLTEITVVVNDLINRKPLQRQLSPVQCRSRTYLGHGRPASRRPRDLAAAQRLGGLLDQERLDQLIQESRYSVHELRIGNLGRQPLGDFEPTPFDECISVGRKELVQHSGRLSQFLPLFCAVTHIESRDMADSPALLGLSTLFCQHQVT